MGRGCALQAKRAYPGVAKTLGNLIKAYGNRTQIIQEGIDTNATLVAFPVKPAGRVLTSREELVWHMAKKFKPGQWAPGWALKADINVISTSIDQLVRLTNKRRWEKIVLVRPGCGAGELSWNVVKPILESGLDDRFYSITYS